MILPVSMKFFLGELLIEEQVLSRVEADEICRAIDRHVCGDFGLVSAEERAANEDGLRRGLSVRSMFRARQRNFVLRGNDRQSVANAHFLEGGFAVNFPPRILHVDADNFFASCEEILSPAFRGRALIVAGGRRQDGIVLSASRRAKEFGIKSGMAVLPRGVCAPGWFVVPRGWTNIV